MPPARANSSMRVRRTFTRANSAATKNAFTTMMRNANPSAPRRSNVSDIEDAGPGPSQRRRRDGWRAASFYAASEAGTRFEPLRQATAKTPTARDFSDRKRIEGRKPEGEAMERAR